MASVAITISGVLYDKLARTSRPVVLVGEASLTDLGVGGGPIIPPEGSPPGIWGPPGPWPQPPIYFPPTGGGEHPMPPIYYPPGSVQPMPPIFYPPGTQPHPEHPIVLPPEQVPPGLQPPTPPAPGSPTTPIPPPAGSSGWPVQPITPPAYLVLNYPGIGPVTVAPPAPPTAQPKRG